MCITFFLRLTISFHSIVACSFDWNLTNGSFKRPREKSVCFLLILSQLKWSSFHCFSSNICRLVESNERRKVNWHHLMQNEFQPGTALYFSTKMKTSKSNEPHRCMHFFFLCTGRRFNNSILIVVHLITRVKFNFEHTPRGIFIALFPLLLT